MRTSGRDGGVVHQDDSTVAMICVVARSLLLESTWTVHHCWLAEGENSFAQGVRRGCSVFREKTLSVLILRGGMIEEREVSQANGPDWRSKPQDGSKWEE